MITTTFSSWMLAAVLALSASAGSAQPAQARASANTDLSARLAQAQTSPQLTTELLVKGRRAAAVCANCHGEGGNSVKPEFPNLAGQNPSYLLDQMRQFADGRRRFEFMEGMIKAMTSDEKVGVALFYASQVVIASAPVNSALAAKGKEHFDKICFRCHGQDGHGNNTYARIAGQQSAYLTLTLKRYRGGQGPRNNPLMTDNTRHMTDADIDAVVAYVTSLK
ncbi:MAG: c-type cytochrome [Rhodoferax sp.]|uniref:c-type cytochrome n=1 Tax=Rhodoferax sp. TaxID=50421 RepID=UPI002603F5EA|nr:c-type cytochrome [Rhodoferax sp.]MDD2879835.1 c-type cytochrome [Rhodoferax sp.]